ncbi:MAG: DNA-binding protein WhiA, partial [Ruthenibacterium sp.]
MSFAQEVKKEVMAHELPKKCCAIAAAYSIACFGKYFDARGIVLHTEQAAVAHYAQRVLERAGIQGDAYPRGKEKSSLYEFAVKNEEEVKKL